MMQVYMDVGDLFLVVFIIMASADSSIFRSFFMYELFTHTHTHTHTHSLTLFWVCVFSEAADVITVQCLV